jgi:hypothetical protein
MSGSSYILAAASVAGASQGGPAAMLLCESLLNEIQGDSRPNEIVGDRELGPRLPPRRRRRIKHALFSLVRKPFKNAA